MRTATVVLLALCATLAGSLAIEPRERTAADKALLTKQKNIIQLLIRVQQPNQFQEQADIGNQYDIEAHIGDYRNPQVVREFLAAYRHGDFLRRGEVFSVLYKRHIQQVQQIFDLFFLAKNYDVFYKTACWARDHINEGQFVYALSIAVLHRQDTQNVILPPPYEIIPQLFTESPVVQKAYEHYMQRHAYPTFVQANYRNISNPEHRISYFTEDLGLSTYNTYLNYEFPHWLNSKVYEIENQRRGEQFYYAQKQLLARYQLERLSLGLPPVQEIEVDKHEPVKVGYASNLRYANGQEVPARPEGVYIRNNDIVNIDVLKNVEARLRNAFDSSKVLQDNELGQKILKFKDVESLDVIGNLVQGNAESLNKRYYKSLYFMLLSLYGHIADPQHEHQLAPGTLENFETMLRDPLYYSIVKRIVNLVEEFKKQEPKYTIDELAIPGVKIDNVDIDNLVTYDENFVYNLNAAIHVPNKEEAAQMDIRVRKQRLNHKPFNVRVQVSSEQEKKVMLHLYLGPKYNQYGQEMSLNEKLPYLVELDRLPYTLQAGQSLIKLNSRHSSAVVQDQITTSVLLKKVEDALQDKEPLFVGKEFRHCGFPEHLQIPRGTKEGLKLSFYVILTPYNGNEQDAPKSIVSCGVPLGQRYQDDKPVGYPFDRQLEEYDFVTIPNFYEKEVLVYHKTQDEINKA